MFSKVKHRIGTPWAVRASVLGMGEPEGLLEARGPSPKEEPGGALCQSCVSKSRKVPCQDKVSGAALWSSAGVS